MNPASSLPADGAPVDYVVRMFRDRHDVSAARGRPAYRLIALVVVLGAIAGGIGVARWRDAAPAAVADPAPTTTPGGAEPGGAAPVPDRPPVAVAAPADLPVIDYRGVPAGFPVDPGSSSTGALTGGLHPTEKLAVYDAPGGRPRALLPTAISGMPVVVPVVLRRTGWVAVLLPSINRTVGWLPAKGWVPRPTPDHLVLRRRAHELTWTRAGVRKGRWTVAVGAAATPTPLGRTFVLGTTTPRGAVYAGVDALVLGSVPEDRRAVPAALRGAHTGIHAWSRTSAFGRSVSNGCIRMPRAAQRTLLANIAPGTTVTVLD